jgi:septal ring factor EnvC (AmiA/AmiB activator)
MKIFKKILKIFKKPKVQIISIIAIGLSVLFYTGYLEYKNIYYNNRVNKLQNEIQEINKEIKELSSSKTVLDGILNLSNSELDNLKANLTKVTADLDNANKRLQVLN